jgi:predicted phage terminase large subunit-like protein
MLSEKLLRLELLERRRAATIEAARSSFWAFCVNDDHKFYCSDNWHLHLICETLQALYERRLTKEWFRAACEEIAPAWYIETVQWDRLVEGRVYLRLMQNLPPRVGKSRTLTNFCKWILGKNHTNRLITCSYNDDLAQSFSRYTRDGITERKNIPSQIVFSDIFPTAKIKAGNASFQEWALEGQFFNYKGSGVNGTITGKGANVTVVDDPVKDAEVAFNTTALDKIWLWYTGTFLSRLEDGGEGGIEIMNMTRWAKGDPCGKILDGPEADQWFILNMQAYYKDADEMLCPRILSKGKYLSLSVMMDESIFNANYHQQPLDLKGILYPSFKLYDDLPRDENGAPLYEKIIAYGDTADEGSDYLCVPIAALYQKQLYLIDVLYTKDGMETTELETAEILFNNKVDEATIESNNGGKGFARNVERILWEKFETRTPYIKWFHQSQNKVARILIGSTYIMQNMYFPRNWKERWPEYYNAMTRYKREGKNKNDDAPDATTGLAELVMDRGDMGLFDYYEQQYNEHMAKKAEAAPP